MTSLNVESRSTHVDTAIRKSAVRLVPFLALLYLINYLDRVNIGFAAESMKVDIGLSTAAFGLGAGLFFVGYCIFEVPSNMLLHRFGARLWISRIMVSWGVLSVLMFTVRDESMFYVLRLLLGIAEAGLLPGIVLYLSYWFPARLLGRVSATFLLALPLAMVFGAPLSTWIIHAGDGLFGLAGWQVMFIVEGLPAVIMGIVVFFWLPARPADARWLSPLEREALTAAVAAEDRSAPASATRGFLAAIREPRVYLMAGIVFASTFGVYAFSFFLPQVIGDLQGTFGITLDPMQVALLTGIPFAVAAVSMLVVSARSDRRQERIKHATVLLLISALALVGTIIAPSPVIKIILLSVVLASALPATPIMYHLPKQFLGGATFAAAVGIIAALGNLSGLVAPTLTGALRESSGNFDSSLWAIVGVLIAGSVLLTWMGSLLRADRLRVAAESH